MMRMRRRMLIIMVLLLLLLLMLLMQCDMRITLMLHSPSSSSISTTCDNRSSIPTAKRLRLLVQSAKAECKADTVMQLHGWQRRQAE